MTQPRHVTESHRAHERVIARHWESHTILSVPVRAALYLRLTVLLREGPQEFKMLFQAREDALQSLSSSVPAARHQAKDAHGQPVGDRGPPERDQVSAAAV